MFSAAKSFGKSLNKIINSVFFTEHFTEQFVKQHRKVCGILIFHNTFLLPKKFFLFQKTVYFIQQILHWGTPYLI